ncbi:MAG: phytochrome-like protein cph1, partial [Daejeonella sp.]|nr:phytochrome-like protein cph1 [Daejeonella sp.]
MIPLSYKSHHLISQKAESTAASALTQYLLLKTEAISHVGSWELNLITKDLTWSDECFRICGYEPGSFVPTIDKALSFFHEDDKHTIKLALDRAVNYGKEFKIDTRIVRLDNTIRFVISQGLLSFNNQQIPERIFVILHDITEEKETALALEESRQIYKSLFEQNPQAVYSFDLKGNFLSANESLTKLTDCSIEELLKISFIPFIDPEDIDCVFDHFSKAGQGEVRNYNARIISSKGRKGYVNITNFPLIVNNTIIGVYGLARDITQELTVQLEVQQSKEELEKIMDYSIDVICTFDEHGYFQKVGAACEKVWGYKQEELIGTRYIDLVYSDDVALTNQIAHETMCGKVFTNFENRYIRKDQTTIPIIWSARWDAKDKIMYCIARDASERKDAEHTLEKSKQKINNVLESITDGFYILD